MYARTTRCRYSMINQSTNVITMTQEQELAMFEELMTNYVERYHEDADVFDPDKYETFLENMTDEEFIAEYESVFES